MSVRGFEPPTPTPSRWCLLPIALHGQKRKISLPVRSKCYCSNGNSSSAERYDVVEIYSRNPLPSRIPVHPQEWRCGESNPSVGQIVAPIGAIPELGFEPRRTPSKGADLPVSRFWII